MDEWFRVTQEKILSRAGVGVSGCLVWLGGPYNTDRYKYGSMRISHPFHDGSSKVEYVHRLIYQCSHGIAELPQNMEVSHRCHNPRCVRVDHLVLEPHATNRDRAQCQLQGRCEGTHAPHCIFH